MLFRIILLSIVIIFMESSKFTKNQRKQDIVIAIGLLVIILISGFRELILDKSLIGTDYFNYYENFYNNNLFYSFKNIGFNIYMYIIKFIFGSHIFMFLISAAIIVITAYIFSERHAKNKYLAFYIFLTFGMFIPSYNILRQWIACSIFLLAFDNIHKGKFWKYAIYILVATTFHLSALSLIALYPILRIDNIKKIKNTTKLIITAVIAVIIKLFFSAEIIFKIVALIDDSYYYRYVTALDQFNQTSNYTNFIVAFAFLMLLLIVMKKYNKFDIIYINLNYLLLLVIIAFNAPSGIIFSRMLPYFLPALMVVVPQIYELLPKKYSKLYYVFCMLLFGTAFIL